MRLRPSREGPGPADGCEPAGAARAARARPCGGRPGGRDLPRQRRPDAGDGRMISSVRGTVTVRRPDHVVIEAAGIGYRLPGAPPTASKVPAAGDDPAPPPPLPPP